MGKGGGGGGRGITFFGNGHLIAVPRIFYLSELVQTIYKKSKFFRELAS